MKLLVLDAPGLNAFVDKLIGAHPVMGVKTYPGDEKHFTFGPLSSANELRLDYDVTAQSPKKYFIPHKEALLHFQRGTAKVEAEPVNAALFVLIGVHPYDMVAINQLDRVMREGNPDELYLKRRDTAIIIGIDPLKAGKRAFWGAMGNWKAAEGYDIWLTDIGGKYVVEAATKKGEVMLAEYASAKNASPSDAKKRDAVRAKLAELGTTVEVKFRPEELPELLRGSFEHPIWEEKAKTCYSCGSCNLVCPTCYCFDVQDYMAVSLTEGTRVRIWDGCLLEEFAAVGSGENFREHRNQRFRHRLFRKGMYLYDKVGDIACVGCGRCSSACLPDIADPVKVFNTLKEGK
jgi:sulfhydrogenase subunit beta (sulfur reductase)